jgi:multiple sugar transport system substrate-binding protein
MSRRSAVVAGVMLAILAAAIVNGGGCTKPRATAGASDAAELELMIWGAPDEVQTVHHYVQAFRRENLGLRVKLQHAPDMGFRQKLEIRLRGGDPPDVFYCDYGYFEDLAERGVLLDLEPFIARDPGFRVADFYPEVLDRFRHQGRLHGICKDFATLVVYVNQDLFDKWDVPRPQKGWTVDDFLAAARALTHDTDGDGRIDEYGFVVETWFGEWAPWVWLHGGEIMDEGPPARFLLGDPTCIERNAEAIDFLAGLMWGERPVAPRPSVTKDMGTSDLFLTGKVAMCTYGRWMCMQLRHVTSFEWNVVEMPRGRPPHGRAATTLFPVAYAVSRETEHPAAWKLVRFLTGRAGQEATAHSGQAIPSLRPVAESDAFARPRALAHLPFAVDPRPNLDAIPVARPSPRHRRWAEIDDRLRRSLEGVWNGTRRARPTLESLQPEIEAILRK